MHPRTIHVLTAYSLLCFAGGVFLLPDTLTVRYGMAQSPPDTIFLTGTVRDFKEAHPDFDIDAAVESGHRASLAELSLGGDYRPVHDPATGFKVASFSRVVSRRPSSRATVWVSPVGLPSSPTISPSTGTTSRSKCPAAHALPASC